MLRVAVLYNQPQLAPDHPEAASEWEIVSIAQLVAEELNTGDWRSELWPARPDFAWVQGLYSEPPDVVFNLFEGFGRGDDSEIEAVTYLEQANIPFTGNPASALSLARDKSRTVTCLQRLGFPVPRSGYVEALATLDRVLADLDAEFPLFLKPALLDASIGIELANVVRDRKDLEYRCLALLREYGPVLIQEFLPGREFNISVIELEELRLLPISEIVFRCDAEYYWPIVTYSAKWQTGSRADQSTQAVCPASIEPELAEKLSALARGAFCALGCRDYARIDIRLDRHGQPKILEVNPNPGYHPEAGFTRSLEAAGWSHAEFSRALVRQALRRAGRMD